MKQILILAVAALSLSACATHPSLSTPGSDGGVLPCGADDMDYLIGQHVSGVDLESLAEKVRVISPGDMVTMDHRPDRLNIDLDASGTIVALRCG
jgi:hypothetical protein